MTAERMKAVEEGDDRRVRLSDVNEGGGLPAEGPGKRLGKRALLSALETLSSVGVAATGGYFLPRCEQIDLKANKRLEGNGSSGGEIRNEIGTAAAWPTDSATGKYPI
jgi:hypothetical protein